MNTLTRRLLTKLKLPAIMSDAVLVLSIAVGLLALVGGAVNMVALVKPLPELAADQPQLPEAPMLYMEGKLRAEAPLEMPRWGISKEAFEVRAVEEGKDYFRREEKEVSGLQMGVHSIQYHPWHALCHSLQPLPREEVKAIPPDIQPERWCEEDNCTVLYGMRFGKPVRVSFSCAPVESEQDYCVLVRHTWSGELLLEKVLPPSSLSRGGVVCMLYMYLWWWEAAGYGLLLWSVSWGCCAFALWWQRRRRRAAAGPEARWPLWKSIVLMWGWAALFVAALTAWDQGYPTAWLLVVAAGLAGVHVYFTWRGHFRAWVAELWRLGCLLGMWWGIFCVVFFVPEALTVSVALLRGYAGEPVVEAPADRVLPENEGKLVRIQGIQPLISEEVPEIREWGIRHPALRLSVCDTWTSSKFEHASSRRLRWGAYRLKLAPDKELSLHSEPSFIRPLPREAITAIPGPYADYEWDVNQEHTWLRGREEGSPRFEFTYKPDMEHFILYLMARQRGDTLEVLHVWDPYSEYTPHQWKLCTHAGLKNVHYDIWSGYRSLVIILLCLSFTLVCYLLGGRPACPLPFGAPWLCFGGVLLLALWCMVMRQFVMQPPGFWSKVAVVSALLYFAWALLSSCLRWWRGRLTR